MYFTLWHIQSGTQYHRIVKDLDGNVVAHVHGRNASELEGNARLVEQAPAMFAMLTRAVSQGLFEKYDEREMARGIVDNVLGRCTHGKDDVCSH